MVLSKNNYKMTKLIFQQIQNELRSGKSGSNTSDELKLNYYDINEIIKLPPFIQRLPPFLQVKLSLLATNHELDKIKIAKLQEEQENLRGNNDSKIMTTPREEYSLYQSSGVEEVDRTGTATGTATGTTPGTVSCSIPQVGSSRTEKENLPLRPLSQYTGSQVSSRIAKNYQKFEHFLSKNGDKNLPSKSELYILYSLLARQGQIISLRAHFIREVPLTLYMIAENIVFLNLSFNQIEEIPTEFFQKTKNLEVLQLRNNPLKTLNLPTYSSSLSKLKVLTLSFCLLEDIPKNISFCQSLTTLDLSYNKIQKISQTSGLGKLTGSLREVDLSGNSLYYLPAEMLKLNLKTFKYSNNFTSPIFWKSCITNSAKKLKHICYAEINKNKNLENFLEKNLAPDQVEDFYKEKYICPTSGRECFGEKIEILRPCKFLWGRKLVPFVFECGSAKGTEELLNKEEIEC